MTRSGTLALERKSRESMSSSRNMDGSNIDGLQSLRPSSEHCQRILHRLQIPKGGVINHYRSVPSPEISSLISESKGNRAVFLTLVTPNRVFYIIFNRL